MQPQGSPIFFFLLYAGFLALAAWILLPFWAPILCALSVGLLFFPMHEWVKRRLGPRRVFLSALVSDEAVLFLFVAPAVLIGWAVVSEAHEVLPLVQEGIKHIAAWVKSDPFNAPWARRLPNVLRQQIDTSSSDVQDRLVGLANNSVSHLAAFGTAAAGNALGFLIDFFIFLFVLFFIFRDGEALAAYILRLMPLDARSKEQIVDKLKLTVIGVLRGTLLTALMQGACAGIGFLIVRTQGAILLGVLTAFATLIPTVGTALVWLPVALIYFFSGHLGKGIFVTAWGILVVGLLDNIVRPYIVGSKADIPLLWLFLGILGGLQIFGLLGILVGPLIIVMIPVLSDIYEHSYMRKSSGS